MALALRSKSVQPFDSPPLPSAAARLEFMSLRVVKFIARKTFRVVNFITRQLFRVVNFIAKKTRSLSAARSQTVSCCAAQLHRSDFFIAVTFSLSRHKIPALFSGPEWEGARSIIHFQASDLPCYHPVWFTGKSRS